MKRILAVVVVGAAAAVARAQEPVPLVAAEEPLRGWTFDYGREFPGARGALTADPDAPRGGGPGLKLVGDFTQGGRYVQAGRNLDGVDLRALSLWLRNPDGAKFTIRLNDGSGQTHQIALRTAETPDWQRVVLPLEDFFARRGRSDAVAGIAAYESWGGANDGAWHGPAKAIYLILGNPGGARVRTLWLSGIEVLPRPAAVKGAEVRQTAPLDEIADGAHDWGFSLGGEFPGAKGALDVVTNEPGAGGPCFRVAADFAGGGAYVAAVRDLAELGAPDLAAIRLRVKTTNAPAIGIQLVDGSGQTHQRSPFRLEADGQWHDVTLLPTEIAGGEHWGGANDGRWHAGATRLALSVVNRPENPSKQPAVLLAGIRAEVLRPVFAQPAAFRAGFDGASLREAGWSAAGDVALDAQDGRAGGRSMVLARTENDASRPCAATGPSFPAAPGAWDVGLAWRAELQSPDNSYRAEVALEALDAAGRVAECVLVGEVSGARPWESVAKRVGLPAGTVAARFVVQLHKTWGRVWVDDFRAAQLAPAAGGGERIARVLFSTAALGNLLLPGDPRAVEVVVEARKPLPEAPRAASFTVRDYWGAEQTAPAPAALGPPERKGNLWIHRAVLDLAAAPLETGRYYEVHLEIPRPGGEPFRDATSLAILPPAETKRYRPEEVPFTSRGWDNRIEDYVRLSDRLGVRMCGIWGSWSAKPPYEAEAPRLDLCEKLGMGWLTGTPAHTVELGERTYSEEALRQGARNLVAKFGRVRPMIVSLGNEPHGTGERVRANVEAYRAVYEEVKKADPTVFVLATAVEPNEEYFRLGYGAWCDAFDFHEYGSVETVRAAMAQYRALMKKYGCEKPLWSTELGLNSQGQTRLAVAREVTRKLCVFFAGGGTNASWFGLLYPDPDGKLRGTSGESHNLFDCRYSRYAPRLDAVAYYHAVNGIAIKRFVAEKAYPDGVHAFLFRDREGRALQVLWKDEGRADVGIPLAGAGPVDLVLVDGRRRALDAAGKGLTLTVTEDPLLLLYAGGPAALPDALEEPAARLDAPPAFAAAGQPVELSVATAAKVAPVAPPFWTVRESAAGGRARFVFTPPAATSAREADLAIRVLDAGGRARGLLTCRLPLSAP